MDLAIAMGMGIIIGAMAVKILYEWVVLDKARTGHRLEIQGELFRVVKDR